MAFIEQASATLTEAVVEVAETVTLDKDIVETVIIAVSDSALVNNNVELDFSETMIIIF